MPMALRSLGFLVTRDDLAEIYKFVTINKGGWISEENFFLAIFIISKIEHDQSSLKKTIENLQNSKGMVDKGVLAKLLSSFGDPLSEKEVFRLSIFSKFSS